MHPPAGSSAFFRGDADCGVAASTRATSLALAGASRLIQEVTTVACLPSRPAMAIREYGLGNTATGRCIE